MIGWIVYDSDQYNVNFWFANKLLDYCRSFCEAKLIIVERLKFGFHEQNYYMNYDNMPAMKPDFVLMRSIFPLLSFFFEQLGIRVFNDYKTSKLCNDKRLTYLSVKKSSVPILDTFFFNRKFFRLDEISTYQFKYPIILKSVAGHGGKEVFLINNEKEMYNTVSSLNESDFLIQKLFYPSGQDLRVYVLGKKIIGSVLRTSDGIKSNYSLGGKAQYYNIDFSEKNLVEKIIDFLPFSPDFVGIDFFYSDNQLVFNEIEDVVGTRMLYDTTNTDAALLYTNYIKETLFDSNDRG